MIHGTLGDIAKTVGASLDRELASLPVRGVSTDTRRLARGDLFFALDGPHRCGRDFVAEALRSGAVAAVAEGAVGSDPRVLVVADALRALAAVAGAVRDRIDVPVIAITGSNGKTTTKDALAAILAPRFRVVAAEASFNNAIGVPLTLCRVADDTEIVILEIGTNAPGEIRALSELARPTVALVTNVGPSHLAGLGDLSDVATEKLSIAHGLSTGGRLFLNADDPRLAPGVPGVTELGVRTRFFGRGPAADDRIFEEVVDAGGVGFRFGAADPLIRAPLRGRHNVMNLLAAAAVARHLGLSTPEIAEGAATLHPAPLRLESRSVGELDVLFDCYNANPASMAAALDSWISEPRRGRRVAVLGDMLELGTASAGFHRELGERVARDGIDVVLFVGSEMRTAFEAARGAGARAQLCHFASVERLRSRREACFAAGDGVLLKASRGIGLERLFEEGA